nr:helix-turn-helix domain-containing protein [Rhodopseudomonas rhenobacensis]
MAEIADVAGLDAALKVAESFGGTRKQVPAQVPDGPHWLTDCVGRRAAEAICKHFRQGTASGRFGGAYLTIPLGPAGTVAAARRRMAKALLDGKSASEAARIAGMTERTAYRARSRARNRGWDDNQDDMF